MMLNKYFLIQKYPFFFFYYQLSTQLGPNTIKLSGGFNSVLKIIQQILIITEMSSEDVALYLIEMGSNERKLEYCRQILNQNTSFLPQAAFNINSAQNKTTLSKSQLFDLFRFTGLTSSQQDLNLIFSYFQIEGKNYTTLQQFSTLVLTQAAGCNPKNLKNMKNSDKYSLKYSLQKLFLQILQNQAKLESLSKFTFDGSVEGSKFRYKKASMDNLKYFLASHGKFPTETILELILKEILLNKGISKRHKIINDYILQFCEKNGNNLSAQKQSSNEVKDITDNNRSISSNSFIGSCKAVKPCQKSLKIPLADVSGGFTNKANANISQNKNMESVQERIKTLMGSINLKNEKKGQNVRSFSKQVNKFSVKRQQKQNAKVVDCKQFNPTKTFSQIDTPQNSKISKIDSVRTKRCNQISDFDINRRLAKYKKSKINSEEDLDNISFNDNSRTIFKPNTNSRTITLENMKQKSNETGLQFNHKHENTKRIEYLKSLVDQNLSSKTSKMEKYRV